jgi:hypothetical protein
VTGLKVRAVGLGLAAVLAVGAAACSKDEQQRPTPKPSTPTPSASATPTPSPKPKQAYDPLTGGKKVDDVVVAVKIDNVAAARPQVGLDKADLIVVERVEADLTRLMAIYHTKWPKRVGPVRSARNTDVQFLPMFGKPALVFSGANGKVAKQVRSSPYLRPVQRDKRDHSRAAPHNVIVDLNHVKMLPDIGKAKPMGFTFDKAGTQWKSVTTDESIAIKVGVDTFGFKYSDGKYRTSWNGSAYVDGDSRAPVLTDNIVRIHTTSHKDPNSTSDLSEVVETTGSGKVTIYSRGKRVEGTWERDGLSDPMTLQDDKGKDIALKPGKTWVVLDG